MRIKTIFLIKCLTHFFKIRKNFIMSAYLASNDVINALSTYFHESNKKGSLRSSYELAVYEHIKTDHKHMTDTQAADLAQNIVNLD